ncbi:MAG: ATP-dependent RNA helicase HrpA [Corynebacterium sp.]|nr:ATP-dependent RNA helicase HrpA [Corynebacterium sp.]
MSTSKKSTNHRQRRNKKSHLHPAAKALLGELNTVRLDDVYPLRRRIFRTKPDALDAIAADITRSQERVAQRAAAIPEIDYPEALPVSARAEDIAQAIEENQVIIVAGETGSGKTTQLPKICLDLGRGRRGLIGHTQPRRLAARTVAERIAEELQQPVGQSVGYAIRFDDKVSDTTAVKVMTEGILLNELQRDRYLNAYDTIIIDEAHERSLNIDFLLGYLKQLLPKRPDLKVIITSATIDTQRFANHFAHDGKPAPIIEVSGRTYPVEIFYRPLVTPDYATDPIQGVIEAVEELFHYGDGDILCFFAGEADIRECMDAMAKQHWRNIEVVPLFGRLSNQEQHRIFQPHSRRRIVLATNIAETSLTVPGIHFVVDTGTARISRYSTRTKVQRLPIEPISQASANQRSGRCGRVADGVAIRLYSEEDFASRPEFTDPEILRTNLASVVLQMAALKLGDIAEFPFLQAPDTKAIRDGYQMLQEIGALNTEQRLTNLGRQIARIPLDPRLARILIEAERLGCLYAAYVVVAALSIQDVRERPLEAQAQADQKHARFKNTTSDFLAILTLWDYISSRRKELSGNGFRKLMREEYLHYLRIREWYDLIDQLRNIGSQFGWKDISKKTADVDPEVLHRSLLCGMLSQIGVREGNTKEYLGTRNTHFMIFPGSGTAKQPPQFVVAAELVETSRLWARNVAGIDPRWVEEYGAALLKHSYSDPEWIEKRGSAIVHQRSTLFGVPVVADRVCEYATIDKPAARAMFIEHALVTGLWHTHHEFYANNANKLADAERLEEKMRRRGIVVDSRTLFEFYDTRIPEKVYNSNTFHQWWKKESKKNPSYLDFDPEKLLTDSAEAFSAHDFPDHISVREMDFPVDYVFDPGAAEDGMTIRIPLPALTRVQAADFAWLVPGMRLELITEALRTLPKPFRRSISPIPDFAQAIVRDWRTPRNGDVADYIASYLHRHGVSGIDAGDFRLKKLPIHLRPRFAAVDRHGAIIDTDRDLAALSKRQQSKIQASQARVHEDIEQQVAKEWTPDTLGIIPETLTTVIDGQEVTTYPALAANSQGVRVKVHQSAAAANQAMQTACLTLLLQQVSVPARNMLNGLPLQARVGVDQYPHGGAQGFLEDARLTALRDLLQEHGGAVRDPQAFAAMAKKIHNKAAGRVRQIVTTVAPAIAAYLKISQEVNQWQGPAIEDMQRQLEILLPQHALARLGIVRLQHLPRYCKAIELRLEEMDIAPEKDEQRQQAVNALEAELAQTIASARQPIALQRIYDVQWMLQELRVSLFAQRLGTAQTVSEKRIRNAIKALRS